MMDEGTVLVPRDRGDRAGRKGRTGDDSTVDESAVDDRPTWVPISTNAMRHVVAQTDRPTPLRNRDIAAMAERFMIPEGSVFQFSASKRVIGDTSVTLVTQSPFRFGGGPGARPGILHISFLLNGHMKIAVGKLAPVLYGPVSAYVLPSWETTTLESTETTRGLDIQLPDERLADRGVRFRDDRFRLDGGSSLGAPLRQFALAIVDAAWTPSTVAALVSERVIEDLVVGMFLEGQGYAMDGEDLREGLRVRASAQIAAMHAVPGVNPAAVAEQLGVSLRHLQRAFEGSGTSVAQEINRARAESAVLLLASPTVGALTLTETAIRAGFNSAFELRSALRSHYGKVPLDFRPPV